jgi:hypothetical protein
MESSDWIEIPGGTRVSVLAPEPDSFTLEGIAYGLAGQHRFAGRTYPRMTVAEHCVQAASYLYRHEASLRLCLLGLLHDAPEGCGLCDLPTPIKHHLPQYREIEAAWYKAILRDMRIEPPTEDEQRQIKGADAVMLLSESARFGLAYRDYELYARGYRPDVLTQCSIRCLSPADAEKAFVQAYHNYRMYTTRS